MGGERFKFEQLVSKSLIARRYRKSCAQVCENQSAACTARWLDSSALNRMYTEAFTKAATAVSNGDGAPTLFHI